MKRKRNFVARIFREWITARRRIKRYRETAKAAIKLMNHIIENEGKCKCQFARNIKNQLEMCR